MALLAGFPLAIGAAFVASLLFKWTGLTPDHFSEEDHGLSVIISNPDFFSFFVAFCAGIAGTLSLTTAKSGALTGVLISVTTIPAAANIGVSAAYADWSAFGGSAAQLAINLVALCIAGVGTLARAARDLPAAPRGAPAQARRGSAERCAPIATLGRAARKAALPACPERCPSGLRSATGNRVGGETCLEGSNPSLSA